MKNLPISSTPGGEGGKLLLLTLLALGSVVLSLCVGSVAVSPGEVLSVLTGGLTEGTSYTIVRFSRLPRTLGCVLAGCALAVSGAVIQSVLANPLAAPNIIGVNSGAGLMVALSCALFPTSAAATPVMAFLGALAGVMLVLFLAERTGAARITLVLAGVAVSSMFGAGIDAVVTFVPEALNGYSDFRIGGMANLTMERLAPAGLIILPALVGVFLLSGALDVLMLGGDTAQSLGLNVRKVRLILLTLAAALAGSAVSFCGLLGFVGLIVPHIMRRLVGEASRPLLLGCALGGAALLTVCDTAARTLFAPYVLPVGIVLSLLGGPFFLWLLLRQRGGRNG